MTKATVAAKKAARECTGFSGIHLKNEKNVNPAINKLRQYSRIVEVVCGNEIEVAESTKRIKNNKTL
jgi:hypothetical protein